MILYIYILSFSVLFNALLFLLVKSKNQKKYQLIFLLSGLFHGLAITTDIGVPVCLLYGPALYLSYRQQYKLSWPGQQTWFHAAPFLALTIVYVGLHTGIAFHAFSESVLNGYYIFYFFAMPVSLLGYGLNVYKRRHGRDATFEQLIDRLCLLNIFTGVLILILFAGKLFSLPQMEFHPQWMLFALLSTAMVLLARHLLPHLRKEVSVQLAKQADVSTGHVADEKTMYLKSAVDRELLAQYEFQLNEYFERSKVYLEPGITAEKVALGLGISKHHFSQLLNIQIGKSFYRFIAYYRIMHALELISLSQVPISIEALANECGFNSKTSFNRYFREFTGYRPSEFKNILYGGDISVHHD